MPEELRARLQAMVASAYLVGDEIAGGGMSRVFLSHEAALKRDVVIKVLPPELISNESVARFRREIELTALLQHPHILPIITSGGEGDVLYYVTPFIRGQSLRDLLASTPRLALDDVVRLLTELLGAIAFAHARGVIHRDIKPGNVLLSEGHAILADFGIARALERADDDATAFSGSTLGTAAYLAPERPRDEAADLYAVAVLGHMMLTGALPDSARSAQTAVAEFLAGTPNADVVRAKAVIGAIRRALSRNPGERFQTAREFRSALTIAAERRAPANRVWIAAVAAGVLVAALLGAQQFERHREVVARRAEIGRIVVAPLQNFTGVDSLGVVGTMAGDWITEGLQKTGIVEVVPTTGAIQAVRYAAGDSASRGVPLAPRVVATEAGAVTVVYGSMYKVRDRIEFRVTIADRSGSRVAGEITGVSAATLDPIAGVEELRTRVMGWLAEHYDDRLDAFLASSGRPPTYEAYRAFSAAMNSYTATDCPSALPLFLRAAHVDTAFVVAPLYASICMTNLGQWARADSLLQRVDRRRGDLNEYNRAWLDYRIAFVHGDQEAQLKAIRFAARLAPTSKAAYNHAVVAFQSGHLHEALATIEAIRPDRGPMRGFAPYWTLYGEILHALELYDREYASGIAAEKMYPGRLVAIAPQVRGLVGLNRVAEIEQIMRGVDSLSSDPMQWDSGYLFMELAEELRGHGHAAESTEYFQRALAWIRNNSQPPWRVAQAEYALAHWTEARAAVSALRRSNAENVDYIGLSGLLAAKLGDRDGAVAIADTLAARKSPYDFGASDLYRAKIAAVLGDREGAIRRLRDSFAQGHTLDLWCHRDLEFIPLRAMPSFIAILNGQD